MTERKDKKGEMANDKLVGSQVPERNEDEASGGSSALESEGEVPPEGKTVAQHEKSAAPIVNEREKELERKLEETKKKLESAEKDAEKWHKSCNEEYVEKLSAQKYLECVDKEFAKLNEIHKGGDYDKIYEHAKEIARWKLESEGYLLSKSNARKFEDAVSRLEKEKGIWTEKNKSLEHDLQDVRGVNESLEMRVKSIDVEKGKIEEEKQQLEGKLKKSEEFEKGLLEKLIPSCVEQGGTELAQDLINVVYGGENFDAALLVLAEFSKFAVMERGDAADLIDWQNQLSDIGLVVAKYFHSQQIPEEDVVRRMRDLAAVLLCSPKPSELGIQLIVPELGEGFLTDEVTHKNRGTRVSKVLNWCVKDSRGSVYSKAIVE